jgi:hypothetical protein
MVSQLIFVMTCSGGYCLVPSILKYMILFLVLDKYLAVCGSCGLGRSQWAGYLVPTGQTWVGRFCDSVSMTVL